jgi:hypothetical protein
MPFDLFLFDSGSAGLGKDARAQQAAPLPEN